MYDEKELETKLILYLSSKGYEITRQFTINDSRNDIVILTNGKKICLELKVNANRSVDEQVDRYLQYYNDGVIVVCWRASKNIKKIFESLEGKIKIPIALVEIYRNQSIV